MKLQELYKLLCVIYAQDIYKAEQYKHLIDYIEHEKAKAFNAIDEEEKEQDIFIAFAIFIGIERAIYKSLPDFMQYHEQWHNRIKEQGKNTRKEAARHRFFYSQVNYYLCIEQNNCKKCKSFSLCPLMKKQHRKIKINIKELERELMQ